MIEPPSPSPPLAPDADCQPLVLTLPDSWPSDGLGPLREVAAQLPDASELSPGTWLAVCDAAEMKRKGWGTRGWGRLWHRDQPPRVHLAARCTALLLRGYADVCADAQSVAYGRVPDATDARSS
jgi:hypothetical protein